MNKEQKMVKEFHEKFGVQALNHPIIFPQKGEITTFNLNEEQRLMTLRLNLIREEFEELEEALLNRDIVEIADALGDLLYVVYGTGVSYGIDLEPIFEEIHRSNMSKGDPEPIMREDGKILKGEKYFKPDLKPLIEQMMLFKPITDKLQYQNDILKEITKNE